MTYGLASWGKALTDVWGEVVVEKKRVISYGFDKVPESLNVFPSAISFITDVDPAYSLGGPCRAVYPGKTEFHVTGSLLRSQMGFVMKFMDEVIKTAAKHITLGGLVVDFKINPNGVRLMQGSWGNENEHFVIEVSWTVQENQSGRYTVSV